MRNSVDPDRTAPVGKNRKLKITDSPPLRAILASLGREDLINVPNYSGPEVIKLFFMLNSAEHEIISANKYENVPLIILAQRL